MQITNTVSKSVIKHNVSSTTLNIYRVIYIALKVVGTARLDEVGFVATGESSSPLPRLPGCSLPPPLADGPVCTGSQKPTRSQQRFLPCPNRY